MSTPDRDAPGGTPHVVILGGGFAGLYAARALRRAPVRITVVDRSNYHVFQPLLYQVATAGLSAPDIGAPIRKILRNQANVTVLLARAEAIDVERCRVLLAADHDDADRSGDEIERALDYDHLVVATGVTNHYFGHDAWAVHAPGLKTLDDALEIRRRILSAYEAAEREPDEAARRSWLTFVVIGAGPTGVELAGALAEIAHETLARDFRRFDPGDSRILLVEGSDRVLASFSSASSAHAHGRLQRLGVTVCTGAIVTSVDEHGVSIGDERIDARTVIWAAGVRAEPLTASLGAPVDAAGRVLVEPDLSVPGHAEIAVVGDAAAVVCDGEPVPGMAPAAIQMGRHVARNIEHAVHGRPRTPFVYRNAGVLATIGRSDAVAEFGKLRVAGLLAWLLWVVVHISFLIGFRNRLVVLFEWAWAYLTYQRSARVILTEDQRA